ncbi:MAG: hypothetical protein QOD02_3998, partial [Mycobacterium sp.]|nr:hypothetical protein [Mycobacterium sp.]
ADWFAVDRAVDGLLNVLTELGLRIGKASA